MNDNLDTWSDMPECPKFNISINKEMFYVTETKNSGHVLVYCGSRASLVSLSNGIAYCNESYLNPPSIDEGDLIRGRKGLLILFFFKKGTEKEFALIPIIDNHIIHFDFLGIRTQVSLKDIEVITSECESRFSDIVRVKCIVIDDIPILSKKSWNKTITKVPSIYKFVLLVVTLFGSLVGGGLFLLSKAL
ncbi:hypothetical protein GCM10007916_28860 [Psychromonas marina]|uniref:Uncharacterized protein n=1 Tax=Psychromonas marina TaxID=88364 RepID=A0ABQ6E482_9GAMM|nr:hypothetical protein [Psychromonas marina]GLS91816.1 hypothetical protein GCM10007916_28860 [Psychromonas marina]